MRKRKDYGLKQNERGIWHCDFYVAGRRIQRSTHTQDRAAAKEWCAEVARSTWREVKLGERPALIWQAAAADWFKDKERDGKRDLANDRDKLVALEPYLDGHALHDFHTSPEDRKGVNLNAVLEELQLKRGWSNSTRNRHRSFVITVMAHARDKGYNVPLLKILRLKELRREARHLTREEAARFIAALPLHLARPARFTLTCGARQANVTGLRWFDKRYLRGELMPHLSADLSTMMVPAAYAKSRKVMRIPLNEEAGEVVREARACKKHGSSAYVFTYHHRPIEQPNNTAFIRAVRACELEGFNWHGLRHTWTTWHLENGTPLEVVQKLGGWSSIHVLLKHYAHLIDAHVSKWAGNVSSPAPASLAESVNSTLKVA